MTTTRDLEMVSSGWLQFFRVYLLSIGVGNLNWETVHLLLYTIWKSGTAREQAFAVLHCTAGDVLIALSSLTLALLLAGDERWPWSRFVTVAALAVTWSYLHCLQRVVERRCSRNMGIFRIHAGDFGRRISA